MGSAEELAHHEVEWWKAHHRKNWDAVHDHMTREYVLLFGLDEDAASEAVRLRLEAAKEHDRAEELEDAGEQEEADVHWDRAEELIRQHFEVLLG